MVETPSARQRPSEGNLPRSFQDLLLRTTYPARQVHNKKEPWKILAFILRFIKQYSSHKRNF
jgi:hypothetical protein